MKVLQIFKTFKTESKKQRELIKLFHNNLKVSKKESDETIKSLSEVIDVQPELVMRFEYKGTEYGMIPNFDKISTGEFIDLEDYLKEGEELHRIASILYRPITISKGKNYRIEEYEGTDKYCEIMMNVDFKVVVSAMVFFLNLRKSLLSLSDTYIKKKKKKLMKKEIKRTKFLMKKNNLIRSFRGFRCFTWLRMKNT